MNTFYEYEGIFGRAETAHLNRAFAEFYELASGMKTLDIVHLRDLYRTICAILGEDELERLNLLLRQRFLIVTPMSGFLQGLTNDLLFSLISRDIETGKQAFQLTGTGE